MLTYDDICRRGVHPPTYVPTGVHDNCTWLTDDAVVLGEGEA